MTASGLDYMAATSPGVSFPRKTGRSCMTFSEQTSEVPQCYLHHNQLFARMLSRIQLLASPWTVALQAPLSMGFPKQEY